jgi:hypothetical protein
MFSSPSFADWKKTTKNVEGTTMYVDYERIRKVGGYVYWWELLNYIEPSKNGDLSAEVYFKSDCKLFRSKALSYIFYKTPMGRGGGSTYSPKNPQWIYPSPKSVNESLLKSVCAYAK